MTTRRITALDIQVEIKSDVYRRLTALGMQVETKPDVYRRLTAIGMMVEISPNTIPANNYQGPRIQAP